ncbi:MAG: methionyl-tRNA formyltransferase [Gallionellaceae bacterium]
MKIIFAGTPHFAEAALKSLIEQGLEVVAVLTQPDRPAGRGMQLKPSPVKEYALQHNLEVLQPTTLKKPEIQQQLASYQADLMVVAAYGLILPKEVLQTPRLGCLNIHASLLPRWRGAAPIQRAILAGDSETGITIMQMDAGLDTGAMLLKKICVIDRADNASTLHDKLAVLGATSIVEALQLMQQGKLSGEVQDEQYATYAAKLSKEEALLDWTKSAEELGRAVRAYNPFPVANTMINAVPIKIWQAGVLAESGGVPGEIRRIEKNALIVACGQGALSLEILQKPNSKMLPTAQFLQGFHLQAGDRFSTQ